MCVLMVNSFLPSLFCIIFINLLIMNFFLKKLRTVTMTIIIIIDYNNDIFLHDLLIIISLYRLIH